MQGTTRKVEPGRACFVADAMAGMSDRDLDALRRAPRRRLALLHIAAHPGASNHQIALGAGVGGDAQISRLLARLRDMGLVVNRAQARDFGGPNAWHLTPAGRRLASAVSSAKRSS